MNVFNPKILDASIRDVASCLCDDQKASLLLYAMQNLPLEGRSRTVIENAVQSCLQITTLSPENTANARVLRAKARLAAGSHIGARQDLEAALMADPDHTEAQALLHKRAVTPEKRLLPQPRSGIRFSNEIWREVALFLPRRDLKTLLFVPHTLSRVASQLLFRKIDLQFSGSIEFEEPPWSSTDSAGAADEDSLQATRCADILTRIIVDPTFASLVRTLRIYFPRMGKDSSMSFRTGMLANALPKMINLRNVHISASRDGFAPILRILQNTSPRLRGLSISSSDSPGDIGPLDFKHLIQFCYAASGSTSSQVHNFIAQNKTTLRSIYLDNPSWNFPSDVMAIRNLTRIDFSGRFTADSQAFTDILANGRQLESLRLNCWLDGAPSTQFRALQSSLPFLRHFAFNVLGVNRRTGDRDLFPAVTEFLRGRAELRTLHLTAADSVSRFVGFDAAVWGVLPSLTNLRGLSITYPSDLAPGLAAWLIPRSVRALTLDCTAAAARDPVPFLTQLRPGVPAGLRYIGFADFPLRTVAAMAQQGFPMVRIVRVGPSYFTAKRGEDGTLLEMEQWSHRQRYHTAEWLEWLGCEDAEWRDNTDFVL